MFRALLLFCAVTEMQSVRYKYISRNSRSNSDPISTGYVYREFNSDPSSIATHYGGSIQDTSRESLAERYNTPVEVKSTMINYAPVGTMKPLVDKDYIQPPISKYSIDYELAKAESKYQSKFLPSKMETDAMYHRLKSIMHYHPPVGSDDSVTSYEHSNEYSLDDDDIRSSSRSSYGSWPYYYHNPYEYEQMKIDAEFEKAKDKRYAIDNARAIIPVHEDLDGDPLNTYGPLSTISYPDIVTDNPISADRPFISFVLNDYFDRNKEDDAFIFKGPSWGNYFDHGSTTPSLDDYYFKRPRRLESDHDWKEIPRYNDGTLDSLLGRSYDGIKPMQGDGTGKKLDDKIQESNNHEKDKYEMKYTHSGDKYNGFKDFVDKFAKMFGSEDHKKESKYTIKKNQDKGEKKKRFRKVYHKNEYQEEDEFYDNNNSTANAEESGKSSGHIGGAEGFVRSHGNTAVENEASAINKNGETDKQKFSKGHESFGSRKEHDKQFNKYRDVAKKAAQSNSADYTDHFRI